MQAAGPDDGSILAQGDQQRDRTSPQTHRWRLHRTHRGPPATACPRLAEYDKGIFNLAGDHPDRSRYIAARDALEGRFAGRILPVDDVVVRRWGAISGAIKRQIGQAPAVIDTLLAATALEHELFLATRNIRDVQYSGAAVFDPWTDDPAQFPLA
jgi:predicted nucleic acid-binding protein